MNPWTLSLPAIGHHEYWRLWTAQLYHLGWLPLMMSAVLALPPMLLMPRRMLRSLPLWILLVMPVLSLTLLYVPNLEFCGASGWISALWGLAGAVLMRLHRREDHIWGTVLVAILVIKLSSEAYGIPLPTPGRDFHTVPLANQAGTVIGLISGLLWSKSRLFKTSGNPLGPRNHQAALH